MTIGTFDGVHVGHRALVTRGGEIAAQRGVRVEDGGGGVVALVFEPHPKSVLAPGSEPARLTGWETRVRLLQEAGADRVVRLEPTRELLGLDPAAFIERQVLEYGALAIVEGGDFRFGKGRRGDVQMLAELGERLGYSAEVVGPVAVGLCDDTVVPARSTMVRWLIRRGRVRDAAVLLGRSHVLEGVVVRGDRRGRTIGFPTANIGVRDGVLLPADGVYAGVAELEDGRRFGAAVNIGERPTFAGSSRTVEAHLLDVPVRCGEIEGVGEYGWGVRLWLVDWVRDQVRFDGVDRLIGQLSRDCARVRRCVEGAVPAGAVA